MRDRPGRGLGVLTIGLLLVMHSAAACSSDGSKRSELPVLAIEGSLPVEETYLFEVGTHCGVGYLSLPINGRFWISDEAAGEWNWMPPEWAETLGPGEELITMEVRLSDDGTALTATLADRSVSYRQTTEADPVIECD